ncbi:MAG: histidinol-phosphate transaminase [Bacteroidota bacterium]
MNDFDLDNLVRNSLKGLQPYASARDEYVSDGSRMVFLDANENPFENGVNRYPDPQQRGLKEILSEQKGVNTENILLGNGSDEILDLVFRAFCEPKADNVITLPPTYGMYKVLAGINNVENKEVLLTDTFEPNVADILDIADTFSKLVFLCSPNNPTGNSFSEEHIHKLLTNFSGLVVLDEAYIDFSKKESWVNRLWKYPNLIVTQTLSKAYGMAGIRLGVCYASKEVIAILNKIKPPYNVNELTQQRAVERLVDTDLVVSEVSKILEEKDKLKKALKPIKFIEHVYPSDANFILVKVDYAHKRYAQLLERGIVVRNRTTQPLCENTLRFTIGTKEENRELVGALNSI